LPENRLIFLQLSIYNDNQLVHKKISWTYSLLQTIQTLGEEVSSGDQGLLQIVGYVTKYIQLMAT